MGPQLTWTLSRVTAGIGGQGDISVNCLAKNARQSSRGSVEDHGMYTEAIRTEQVVLVENGTWK